MAAPTPIALSISDPISADVQAIAGAVTAVFLFLATPQGQAALKQEQTALTSLETAATSIFGKVFNGLAGFLGKIKL